jgi:hypothetical protein
MRDKYFCKLTTTLLEMDDKLTRGVRTIRFQAAQSVKPDRRQSTPLLLLRLVNRAMLSERLECRRYHP